MSERCVAIVVLLIVFALGSLSLFIPADRQVVSGLQMLLFGGGSIAFVVWMIIRTRLEHWIPPVAWGVLLMLFFFIVGAGFKWFPSTQWDEGYESGLEKTPTEYVFCEGYVEGWILQPISVWTDLAFMTSGVALIRTARPCWKSTS